MAFDVTNFVINRVIRGSMVSPSTGDILWNITQIESPSLKCTGESVDAVDAIGAVISSFDRAKKAEFSGSNSLFDLNLLAAQMGSQKKIASNLSTITTPKFETFDVQTDTTEIVLKEIPAGVAGAEIKQIYALKSDSSIGEKFSLGAAASATDFALDAASKTITLPTKLTGISQIMVRYDYEASAAVEVANTAIEFPKAGKFIMEVLGHDVCSPDVLVFAYLILPNAKLSTNVDISFATEGKHPFTMNCMQNYCDKEKRLFNIIVPEV